MAETTTERKRRTPAERVAKLAELRRPVLADGFGPETTGGYSTFAAPMAPVPATPGGFASNPGGNMTNLGDRMRRLAEIAPVQQLAPNPNLNASPQQIWDQVYAERERGRGVAAMHRGNVARLQNMNPPPVVAAAASPGNFNVPAAASLGPAPEGVAPAEGESPAAAGIVEQMTDPRQRRLERYAATREGVAAQRQRLLNERMAALQAREQAISNSPTLQAVMQNAQFGRHGGAMMRAMGGQGNGPGSIAQAFMMGGPQYAQAVAQDQQLRQAGQEHALNTRLTESKIGMNEAATQAAKLAQEADPVQFRANAQKDARAGKYHEGVHQELSKDLASGPHANAETLTPKEWKNEQLRLLGNGWPITAVDEFMKRRFGGKPKEKPGWFDNLIPGNWNTHNGNFSQMAPPAVAPIPNPGGF